MDCTRRQDSPDRADPADPGGLACDNPCIREGRDVSASDHDREKNTPKHPLETMSPRHSLLALRGPSKGNTTLVPPSVMASLRADIVAINRGEGVKQGNRSTINGRTYV